MVYTYSRGSTCLNDLHGGEFVVRSTNDGVIPNISTHVGHGRNGDTVVSNRVTKVRNMRRF